VALPSIFEGLDESPLARSPIVTVVWQVRFEEHLNLVAPQTALILQELLGGAAEFSLTMLPEIKLSVQPVGQSSVEAAPAMSTARGGWRLSAVDGSWHLNVETRSVSIEAASYGSWASDFSPRLQKVLKTLEDLGAPVIESRLGLRYINIVVGSSVGKPPMSAAGELSGIIAPWLLGPLNESQLEDYVQVAQGRAVFGFDHVNAVLNHGVVTTENGELGYLIDVDAFREGGRAFHSEDILAHSATLHLVTLGLFQRSLTPEILKLMRSTSRPESP
jgi:uncharacterized protein (TIGR04255 family)